jgi:hypothetical protein
MAWSVRARRFVLAAVVAGAVGGCALIVGDPVGSYVTPDAGGGVADASHPADHTVPDAGPDTASVGSDASEGGLSVDAAADAGGAGDAAADAVGDAIADAGDAAEAGGFCQHYTPPTAAWFTCDDFDDDTTTTDLGYTFVYGGTARMAVRSDASASSPNALWVSGNPDAATDASQNGAAASAVRLLPVASSYSIDLDVKVGALPAGGNTQLVEIGFDSGASVALAFDVGDAGTIDTLHVDEADRVDAGTSPFRYHPTSPFPAVPASGWNHISFSIGGGAAAPTDTLIVNGKTIDATYGLGGGFFSGTAHATIGWYYLQSPGVREAYIDNVVVVAQ